MISFDNTELAYAYKSNKELKRAHFLFSMMGSPFILKMAIKLTPLAINWHLPFTKTALRSTIFKQFIGGETLEETAPVAEKLGRFHVQTILDYGVEGGNNGEKGYDQATDEFIKVINYAATQENIPFMSIKITGIVRSGLLQKLDTLMHQQNDTLMKNYEAAIQKLPNEEKEEWQRVLNRFIRICETAKAKDIGVLVDAEESWIQDPVDAMTMMMMDVYNKEKALVFNTLQLYRHDRYEFLKKSYEAAEQRNFILAVKLVRGAYMEKERERALELGYASPIQPDKQSCDADYDASVDYCIAHVNRICMILASHNELSNLRCVEYLKENKIPFDHKHVHFSQLYGMSDNITFNLAHAGLNVSKYLPFGPIKDVVPYLMRRAQENSSVSGQTGRELSTIEKELKRRNQKN
ncbi:MAG: proline dehydrogenase [Niastella sp. SCN 39-18]|nr:MAG: proline dehydrogenase [Niastella sp. SCN 39-18]OJW08752.1 MAG: proline dehydrogenase [Sphingobacteriales bacterium 39-19]